MRTLDEVEYSSSRRDAAAERPAASLRMVLVDDDADRAAFVTQALRVAGHDVVARLSANEDLLSAVRRLRPDVILVDMDNPARDVLDNCAAVTQQVPRPIIFFARDSDPDTISRAVRAGVSAYIVDGLAAHRIKPILDVAIARFREHQKLRNELDDMRTRLADRRDVERAKSMLARVRRLDEAQAYALLRRSAMARRITIGEAARTVLAAAELFDPGAADVGGESS
ncbi:ANTAR domain-containing response regulator [Solimonas terrae]|uniref:ANTAR domain-containing protein n=1 Tax=Solimonas terrae TaxID=1396819 RepID=A0A6M2BM80_9GAMM|nr:ANTAR domain-containing protein [Solimonas terrae]NGY03420.1 ANTAR domain-containing protein [Solimonas terrae]